MEMFPNSARSHLLLSGHMTSNNETVSRQNLCTGNIAKSMTSEGNVECWLDLGNLSLHPQEIAETATTASKITKNDY